MSIESLLIKTRRQTAVYWESTGSDGYSGQAFSSPVLILCRWTDIGQLVVDDNKNEVWSRSKIIADREIKKKSFLMLLGDTDDIESSSLDYDDDPLNENDAWQVILSKIVPDLRNTVKVYVAHV